jgi:hypothetical protein
MEIETSVHGHEPTVFEAVAQRFDAAQRRARARRVFFPLLLGALLSVPIPGWHFVGVPGFLVAAILMARRRLRQEILVESVSGRCPACGVEQTLEAGLDGLPASLPCPACGEFLQLSAMG